VEGPGLLGGRYELRDILGFGGMAEVRDGWDTRLNRPVAIKLLSPGPSSQPTIRERFKVEACAAAALNHPNIVGVYDFGDEGGTPFIVMERLPGDTLGDQIALGPLSQPDTHAMAADAVIDRTNRSIVCSPHRSCGSPWIPIDALPEGRGRCCRLWRDGCRRSRIRAGSVDDEAAERACPCRRQHRADERGSGVVTGRSTTAADAVPRDRASGDTARDRRLWKPLRRSRPRQRKGPRQEAEISLAAERPKRGRRASV
jgi:hypothetical protein